MEYPPLPLHALLSKSAREKPEYVALVTTLELPLFGRVESEMTYAELERYSNAFAAALVDMGLKKGDRVALVMPNIAAFVISFYAVLKAGGVVAATNPTYPSEKIQFQINDCGARFIITMSLYYDKVKEIQPDTKVKSVVVTNVKEYFPAVGKFLFTLAKEKKEGHRVEQLAEGDCWLQDLLKQYDGQQSNVEVTPDDLALFQYTGGTTGVPKAAMAPHKALVANTLQINAVCQPGDNEIYLGALPMFHVFGLVAVLGAAVQTGARIILIINARETNDVIGAINKYKPTLFHGVPALYNAVNNNPIVRSGEVNLRSLRACISGSAPLSPATKQEFEKLTGAKLLEGYGMSEAPTASHVNPLRGENRTGSIGLPMPDMDIRIVSLDDEVTDVPVGEIGELVMAGPQVMCGYYGMPTETANALRERDGKVWLYTGDIARMDEDGYFYIVDRKKDMALIGGFGVYPNAVEKAIKEHPAVFEVGVAAIPHPEKEGQEALKAWVVLNPGMSITEKELMEHCSQRLARYEVPSRYSFVDELPKSTVGKTLRRELIRMELEESERALS
ncbi:MAG: long-chain fatty acid--CoA ligase [Anaerolineae bacterium]|nr:long-chain fatty acid--CoA ligase [Anaerolineae bacterium]